MSFWRSRPVPAACLALAFAASPALAQGPPLDGPPPPDGPRLYEENCSQCHGEGGDGVANVDLMHGRFRRATTDAELVGIVLRGIPGTDMPPHSFSEAQAAAVVQYLRATADRSASIAGDAAKGRTIFAGKGNCASCHRVRGEGSRLGPDLTEIGRLRHSDEIRALPARSRRDGGAEQPLRADRQEGRCGRERTSPQPRHLHHPAPRLQGAARLDSDGERPRAHASPTSRPCRRTGAS